MKKILLASAMILGACLTVVAQEVEISKNNLSKKWMLEKYSVFGFTEKPSDNEKSDYIFLKSDNTFSSVSEGKYEEGKWELDTKNSCITLRKENEEGVLLLIIEELKAHKLVLYIYDPNDNEAEYLKIHFKS